MKVDFEKSPNNGFPLHFFEKHVLIIDAPAAVSALLDKARKAGSSRNFGGQTASTNSVMCMTAGQREELFSWLLKNKEPDLNKTNKNNMLEISGIPNYGAIFAFDKKQNKMAARGGGTVTLGFIRQTSSIAAINHFGGHDWSGSFVLKDDRILNATETAGLTK